MKQISVSQMIGRGNANLKNGKFVEAEQLFAEVLMSFPNNVKAKQGLKRLNGGRATPLTGSPPQKLIDKLIGFVNAEQLEIVIGQATNLLVFYPKAASLWNILGIASAQLARFDKAIEAFEQIIILTPMQPSAYFNLGNVLKDQGKLEEAIEAYSKALAIKPDYEAALNNVVIALKTQGKSGEQRIKTVLETYKKTQTLKTENFNSYFSRAFDLQVKGKLEEAIEAYRKALAIRPNYADAYYNIGVALQRQGKLEEAMEAYRKALAIRPDYAEVQHMVSALTGKTTSSAPRKYVETLFDSYAKKFETNLVNELEYRIPKLLKEIITDTDLGQSLGSVLDLGCGTGLMGLEIKDFCSNLKGIDLSREMIKLADTKNVYDQLFHRDIIEYLSNEELNFDYFISTDVFIYLGELSDLFRLIKSKNKRAGKLVFSTEHTELDGFQLEKTGRYSHSKTYIQELCAKYKYTISHFSMVDLRKENGQFINGGLYILDF